MRADDLDMLQRTLACEELSERSREAFQEMLNTLTNGDRNVLSTKQREWVRAELENHEPQYENAFSAGKVPLGRPLPKLDFERMPKPLKPPGW